MKLNLNTLWLGIVSGLLAPLLVLFISYLSTYSHISFKGYLNLMIMREVLTPLISLCVVVNLLLFFIFIWAHRYYSARGIIFSTLVYAIIVVALKTL